MSAQRKSTVTGAHFFTFPYRIGVLTGAEYECRCRYVASPETGAARGIHEITDIEVEAARRVPREEHVRTGRAFSRSWVVPDPHLAGMIRAYLLSPEGAEELLERAQQYGVTA